MFSVLAFHADAIPVFEPVQALVSAPEMPYAKLIQGADGNFYGTSFTGGNHGSGCEKRFGRVKVTRGS